MKRAILIVAGLSLLPGCTLAGLWDAPQVEIEERSCRVDADCASVRFTVDPSLRNDPCLVAVRSCDVSAERCVVDLQARDSDGDGYRDTACAGVRPEFAPFGVDCDDADASAYPNADLDGDGFVARGCGDGLPEDCDDTRATAYPGATVEACDGVVSTCTDATPPLRRTVEDFDGDRFAPIDLDPSVCVDVLSDDGELLSIPHTDCDDLDPNVYPGAPDVCDGRHNDCESPTGVGPDLGEDVDGDGFASPSSLSCDPDLPGGLPNSDCDDLDPNTYPAAQETCDGLINNCNERRNGAFMRPVEDPDGDGKYAGNASCVNPVVDIECINAAFDRFSTFCLPSSEAQVATSVAMLGAMVSADFNGNGFEELVFVRDDVGCAFGGRIYLYHSFQSLNSSLNGQVNTCDAVGGTVAIFAAQADDDPELEVVTLSGAGAVMAYDVGPGSNPTLTVKQPMGITVGGTALAVGELAGAAAPVVIAVEGGALVSRPLDADAVAGSATTVDAAGAGLTGLLLTDVDGDTRPDLLAYGASSATLRIYPGTATGGFGMRQNLDLAALLPGVGNPREVAVGDVEGGGDGDMDIVVSGSMGLGLLARRDGAYVGMPVGVLPNGESLALGDIVASDIDVRDMGSDGSAEIVYAVTDRDSVGYIDEIGSGLFAQHVFVADLAGVTNVAAGDFDGDVDVDVAAYSPTFQQVVRYQSYFVSNMGFSSSRFVDRSVDVGSTVAYDVDADGATDLIGASSLAGGEIVLWRARSRDFSMLEELVVGRADGGEVISGLAAGDVTGDERADFAVVSEGAGLVGYIRGIGDLTYAPRQALAPFDGARAVAMGDLDGDGLDEILVAANGGSEGRLAVYARESGGASFSRTVVDTTTAACTAIALGDVDDDGDLDVALSCGTDGVVVLRNPGQMGGAFEVVPVFDGSGGANASSVALFDMDRDGAADVVSYRADLASVRVDLSRGGSFGDPPTLVPADVQSPSGALVTGTDLDADGDLDLVVAGLATGSPLIYLQLLTLDPLRFVPGVIQASVSGRAVALVPLDVSGDRYQDFAVSYAEQRNVIAYRSSPNPWWGH